MNNIFEPPMLVVGSVHLSYLTWKWKWDTLWKLQTVNVWENSPFSESVAPGDLDAMVVNLK